MSTPIKRSPGRPRRTSTPSKPDVAATKATPAAPAISLNSIPHSRTLGRRLLFALILVAVSALLINLEPVPHRKQQLTLLAALSLGGYAVVLWLIPIVAQRLIEKADMFGRDINKIISDKMYFTIFYLIMLIFIALNHLVLWWVASTSALSFSSNPFFMRWYVSRIRPPHHS